MLWRLPKYVEIDWMHKDCLDAWRLSRCVKIVSIAYMKTAGIQRICLDGEKHPDAERLSGCIETVWMLRN